MQHIPRLSIDNPTAGMNRYDVILSVNGEVVLIRTFAEDNYQALNIAMGVAGYDKVDTDFGYYARRVE